MRYPCRMRMIETTRRWISELDRDGDGTFEVRRELDAIAEPVTRD